MLIASVRETRAYEEAGADHIVYDLRFRYADWFEQSDLLGNEVLPACDGRGDRPVAPTPESDDLVRAGFGTCPYKLQTEGEILGIFYAFPASFNPRSTFSGLSGSLLMRTPVALKIALAMAAMGGTQAISPAPLAP